jgi:hypothetical protein
MSKDSKNCLAESLPQGTLKSDFINFYSTRKLLWIIIDIESIKYMERFSLRALPIKMCLVHLSHELSCLVKLSIFWVCMWQQTNEDSKIKFFTDRAI